MRRGLVVLSEGLFYLFAGLVFAGSVVWFAVVFRVDWSIRQLNRIGELRSKSLTEVFQIASGLTGVCLNFALANERQTWLPAMLTSFLSAGVWKLVQLAIDHRLKSEADRAKATSETLGRLLVGIHSGVMRKLKRVQDAVVRAGRPQATITHVRDTLTPRPHLDDLLEQLATVLQREVRVANVRVGVFVNRLGGMTPVHGSNLQNPGYIPFNSYETYPEFYRLGGKAAGSHVVKCVREKQLIIVPDCKAAAGSGEFHFSSAAQQAYLKSLIVCPLGEVCDGGKMVDGVLAVDSNQVGFFGHADHGLLESVLREFGLRIRLEMALLAFLEKREDKP